MRPRRRRPSPELRAVFARHRAEDAALARALARPSSRSLFPGGHPRGRCWKEAALAGEFGPEVMARTLRGDPCDDFA